jgi:hypothetical protein
MVNNHYCANWNKCVQNDQGAYSISSSSACILNNAKLCFALQSANYSEKVDYGMEYELLVATFK